MGSDGISCEYLSSGANRQTAVADWSRGGVLAFGADSNVALWQPSVPRGITALLGGHKGNVKAVSFLPEAEGDELSVLISGSDDGKLIVRTSPVGKCQYETVQESSEHSGAINCITAVRLHSATPSWLIATGGADAVTRIWRFADQTMRLVQVLKMNPKIFPLCLALSPLDTGGHTYIMAAAGTRDIVQIFTVDMREEEFGWDLQATLSGHEGWIRSLHFTKEDTTPESDLLLASASQDKYVRIWRVHQGHELPAAVANGADPLSSAYLPGKSPANKAHKLEMAGKHYSITFEALLLGHEDWIYSARWNRHTDGRLQLLSTSADNSLAIWESDPSSGIWVSVARLGEISREKGATTATGSTGGFWTGLWSPEGTSVACLGRTGSWRLWEYYASEDSWRPQIAVSGHTKAVTGIAWSRDGEYLLSTSSDQTTRLHTQWTAPGKNTWHEMSRPQIHGYDLNCIDSLGTSQFVSGADEKLMRVFSEPRAVAAMLKRLGGFETANLADRPDAANMPVLGLSNKAIDAVDDDQEVAPIDDRDREALDPASIVKKSYLDIDHPPFEETLSRHTLWPEIEKLYGHGYELSCLSSSHDGKLIASACKASSTNHAVIRLFETEKWTEIRPPLTAHSLTATRLRFSKDDRYLLSVGRDRQWAVFERGDQDELQYQVLQSNAKGHSRMILDASWLPSSAETLAFATAGRDKQVRIWSTKKKKNDDSEAGAAAVQFVQTAAIPCDVPVTAIDALPTLVRGRPLLAVGTEAGRLGIFAISDDFSSVAEVQPVPPGLPKSIHMLAWRPKPGTEETGTEYTLAVAGDDSSLRVYSFGEGYLEAQEN